MAKDDMFVVMYKIISYLYDCMKHGEEPNRCEWDANAFGINQTYWERIVSELVDHGYIGGVTVTRTFGNSTIIEAVDPYVTAEGVQFAIENTMMQKAKKFLQDAKAAIPFV